MGTCLSLAGNVLLGGVTLVGFCAIVLALLITAISLHPRAAGAVMLLMIGALLN